MGALRDDAKPSTPGGRCSSQAHRKPTTERRPRRRGPGVGLGRAVSDARRSLQSQIDPADRPWTKHQTGRAFARQSPVGQHGIGPQCKTSCTCHRRPHDEQRPSEGEETRGEEHQVPQPSLCRSTHPVSCCPAISDTRARARWASRVRSAWIVKNTSLGNGRLADVYSEGRRKRRGAEARRFREFTITYNMDADTLGGLASTSPSSFSLFLKMGAKAFACTAHSQAPTVAETPNCGGSNGLGQVVSAHRAYRPPRQLLRRRHELPPGPQRSFQGEMSNTCRRGAAG